MKKLQVLDAGKWKFVFCRHRGNEELILTHDKSKAIPATQHSLQYFKSCFPDRKFQYSNN